MPPEKGPSTYCKFVQLDEWAKFVPDKDDTSNLCCNWTEVIICDFLMVSVNVFVSVMQQRISIITARVRFVTNLFGTQLKQRKFSLQEFKTMINNLREKCQQYVNLHIQKLVVTSAWKELPIQMQNKLKEGNSTFIV